jgi:diguanylate cyclase (GGDEF)-like protein/PAS domain S-box-containing protein
MTTRDADTVAPGASTSLPKPVLLVVDDQPANIEILYALFRSDHEVCMATSGQDALLFCQSRKPDLILLDIVMPDLSGYQICEQLKADARMRDVPIIFVTGQTDPMEEARGLDAGGADFIVKPFHATVVRARVRTQLMLKQQADLLRQRETELRQRHAELKATNDSSPWGLFHTDATGVCNYVNRSFEEITGLFGNSALGAGWRAGIHPDDVEEVSAAWFNATAHNLHYASLHRYRHADGRITFARAQAAPVTVDGIVTGFVGTLEDVTMRLASENALKESEQRLRLITDNLPVLVTYIDSEKCFRFANATLKLWTGIAPEFVIGKQFIDIMGADGYDKRRASLERALAGERVVFEMVAQAFGQERYLQSTYLPDIAPDGSVRGIYTLSSDITAMKHTEVELRRLARFDSLTGLPNRGYLYEILDAAIERGRRSGAALAVLFLDIDHFKAVNDTHGHGSGDLLLQEFARRLSLSVRKTDTVARLAGDEFVILLEGAKTRSEVEAIAAKIIANVRMPWTLAGVALAVTTSIGIAFDQSCSHAGSNLIAQADDVLYEAKAAGRDGFRLRVCGDAQLPGQQAPG